MLLESYALILGIICTIAAILEKGAPRLNTELAQRLERLKNKNYSEIFNLCNIFILEFKNFYFERKLKHKKHQNYLWAWIIISFILTLVVGFLNVLIGQIIELRYALFGGFFAGTIFFGIYITSIVDYNESNSSYEKIRIFVNNFSKYRIFELPDLTKIHPIKKSIVLSILTALKFSMFILIGAVVVRFGYPIILYSGFPSTELFEIDIYTYLFIFIILALFIFIIMFLLSLFSYLVLHFVSNYKLFIISPIRTFETSLVFFLMISSLNIEVIDSFISVFHTIGWIILFYGLLNVFADSFSILETYYILNKISDSRKAKDFIVLLIIDFFASAFIFLVIPLITGNLNVFFDAIWFKGESPWLGILFWTTFSTSISLYLYILSIIILAAIYRYSRIDEKYIPITRKPIYALTLIVIIIVSIFVTIQPIKRYHKPSPFTPTISSYL